MTNSGSYVPGAATPGAATPGAATPAHVADLQQLSRDYASFSRSKSGLGNVLGGVIGLVVFGAVWLLGGGIASAIITVGLTLVWLIGKEAIRRRLYRRFGEAREIWAGSARRTHRFMSIILTLAALGFAAYLIADGWVLKPVGWPYLIFCLVTPLIVWRTFFTVPEMVLGFDLLFMGAITASGHTPDLLGLATAPAYAAAMIGLGLAEHRQFKALERRLQASGGDAA